MSIEASWDLRSKASPRSLCLYTAAATSQETNPFEVAASGNEAPSAQAVVYGTERGSLHYRTYAMDPAEESSSSSTVAKSPLGVIAPGQRQPPHLPRAYLPVDLAGASLPGEVVNVIPASSAPSHRPVFLVLVDDNRGTSNSQPGQYAATLVTLQHGSFSKLPGVQLPRMSCATFSPRSGFVFCGGRRIQCLSPEMFLEQHDTTTTTTTASSSRKPSSSSGGRRSSIATRNSLKPIEFPSLLPTPGVRGGQDALAITCHGKVAVVAVGNSVYAVPGTEVDAGSNNVSSTDNNSSQVVKVVSFAQSSQVHPVIVIDIEDQSMDPDWASLLLANGREAAVIDMQYSQGSIHCSAPRNVMVTLASPILAAATSWPWLALLTSDGLISIRSPSCLAIPLKTVEVGTRPNDFFVLRTFQDDLPVNKSSVPYIVAMSYSGQAKVLQCQPDTAQDLADRLMRHSIDAFGSNGFPRSELAEALNASFTATSYVGPEPSAHARDLLRQYLEAVLGLADLEGGASSGWPTEGNNETRWRHEQQKQHSPKTAASFHLPAFEEASQQQYISQHHHHVKAESTPVVTAATPSALVTGTALLCLVCTQLSPSPKYSLANRAAKACAAKMGVVIVQGGDTMSPAAIIVCESVADRLLREATKSFSLLSGGSAGGQRHQSTMEFVEAATWLLRSCGEHERAIDVLHERFQQHRAPEATRGGFWSQIKYESYTATHLSELWATSQPAACQLVLQSPATQRLLEHNPRLGLNVFTVLHPQNETQWKLLMAKDDPLAIQNPSQVVGLLKSINPAVPLEQQQHHNHESSSPSGNEDLPMDSGRALCVAFLESAIGINTGRPTEKDAFDSLAPDESAEERIADFHDELCYLLLEGVISERGDTGATLSSEEQNIEEDTTTLGNIYRGKLRRLLRWPLAKIRSEHLLNSLPKSFLQEQALVLGRLGKHEDALRILYCDCQSMELALEYCDLRHEQLSKEREQLQSKETDQSEYYENQFSSQNSSKHNQDCAYLPLVKVALQSDKKRGTTAAIQVLALRRNAIDRAAALRLLPKNVPVSAVARPFLIPALVESESQARRLKVVSSLLRARHSALKQKLTEAQLKAQANLHVVPQLRSLNLGDPLHSTKPFKARPSSSASPTFPDVVIVKHFFPRHVVIQAKVSNCSGAVDGRALGNIAFVVAESSEEAIQSSAIVPIKLLPFKATGSTWCVLVAAPNRMEGTAILTCELRYTVLTSDTLGGGAGRTFVEELQDLEVFSSHFS